MSAPELKPCPFCGGPAARGEADSPDCGSFIHCIRCDASTALHYEFRENLVDAWNRRSPAPSPAIEQATEALRDIGVYGCGMLNQPAAMNGPEEAWLRKRIAEYERVARMALAALEKEGGQ